MRLKLIAVLFTCIVASCAAQGCVARDYGYGSIVCVCNSTYCDLVEETSGDEMTNGNARHYVTSKAGMRLHAMTMKFSNSSDDSKPAAFKVDRSKKYQKMYGFGGAITDAAGLNTFSLSSKAADNLIRAYFQKGGIGYTFIRVPVGGTDFSTHNYEYTDDYPNDTSLKHFNLSMEDYSYKIPFIKKAIAISDPEVPVKLFSAPWSAPSWMKNNNKTANISRLREEYYQVYADYYIKFLDAYAAEGLKFWGLTPQNEPGDGVYGERWNAMSWSLSEMQEWLVGNLCPSLKSGGYSNLKLMINDNQRYSIPTWVELYKNESVRECASGMAVHWYTDRYIPASVLTETHDDYPDKFLLYTEACVEKQQASTAITLGDWSKGVRYMSDIIDVTTNWVTGWVDWNMVLDLDGGPNWAKNEVDAPVIVNATADEFYKQPMFYALAHFSRFVPPGSVRVGLQAERSGGIESVAFLTPDNATVVILHNTNDTDAEAVISDPDNGKLSLKISANSMNTVLYY
ncbi:putative glucosylceramidase 4 [Bacillus rossius redtenbacheri]|uniref:putative glucosylceramidase 4 n=1 Tax=Bacillus rossius redtenbacheri TaxID=93214 RepID=UPI002FDDD649